MLISVSTLRYVVESVSTTSDTATNIPCTSLSVQCNPP